MKNYRIKIFNEFSDELKIIWSNLQKDGDCYLFQTYEWQEYWFSAVGTTLNLKPLIVCVYDSSKLIAIFPLGLKSLYGIKIIEFLGGGQSDYNNPIFSDKVQLGSIKELWNEILAELPKYDVIYLSRIPEKLADSRNPFMKTAPFKVAGSSYYSKLPDSLSKMPEIISKRTLKDNRRMERRLAEKGLLEFVIADNSHEYNLILTETLKQKRDRYLATGANNILEDESIYLFYRGLFENIPCVHLSALKIDGEIIATHLGVIYKKRFYYLMPTFLPGFYEKYSPGRVLLEYLTKWSIESGMKVYDFTTGAESYKKKWCNKEMNIYNYQSYSTFKGFLFIIVLKTVLYLKNNSSTRPFLMKLNRLRKG